MTNEILLTEPNVKLTPFYKSGSTGVADSIEAVQKASDMIRLPPYGLVIARAVSPKTDALWNQWYDLDEEQIRVSATKSYDGISQGEHRLFLVGSSSFSHDPESIRAFVKGKGVLDGKKEVGLTNYSVPLSQGQVDRVLGDKIVYVTGVDGKPQERNVDSIMSYDQFLEASADKGFLADNGFYVVQFPEAKIQDMNSDYLSIGSSDVRNHPTSIVRSGGKVNWQVMLSNAEDKGWSSFYVGNPDLDQNSGRVGILSSPSSGFHANHVNNHGRSLGVAPEALDALVQASQGLVVPKRFVKEAEVPYAKIASATVDQVMKLSLGFDKKQLEDVINNGFEQYQTILKQ